VLKNMNRRIFLAGVVAVLSFPKRLFAQGVPVIDAANLAQSVLTAIRTLQSNINEGLMIANQVKSLANELKNLTSLNFSIVDEFGVQFRDLFKVVGTVQGLMRDFESLQTNFEELYPDFNNMEDLISSETVAEQANKWLDESRSMIEGAALTGAKVLENLPATKAQLDKLIVNSQSSVGILQASQAGNQIAATISGNLMNLSTQLATYSQAHMSYLQKHNSKEAANQNRLNRMLEPEPARAVKRVEMRPF
jgi:P-type conjugative transfer protein TrbJ